MTRPLLLLLAAACTEPLPMSEGEGPRRPFVHERALLDHAGQAPFGPGAVVPYDGPGRQSRDDTGALIMGYLPYWEDAVDLPWERLDILVWFSVGVNGDGTLGNDHGWGGAGYEAVLASAHAAGVQVLLGATRFGGSELHTLLGSPDAAAQAIDGLVARMLEGNGDGIDVDFEGLLVEDRDAFVTFVQDLRAAMDAVRPGATLTLAMPAIDWEGAYDYDVLASTADALFVMGYAFHGSWGNPGPQAPLSGGDPWGSYSLTWTVEDYLEWAGEENASKILLGLPLYGWEWAATGPDPGAAAVGDSDGAVFWAEARVLEDEHGALWEPTSATPYVAWQDGGQWRQMWCDDHVSIGLKAELARERGLGGFGFWALGYDDGDAQLWDAVRDVAQSWDQGSGGDDDEATPGSGEPSPVVVSPVFAVVGDDVPLDASGTTDPDGDALLWAWVQDAGTPVQLQDASASVAHFVATSHGTSTFRVSVSDGASEPVEATVEVVILPREDETFFLPEPQADLGYGCGASIDPSSGRSTLAGLLILRCLRRRPRR